MEGTKALALDAFAERAALPCCAFDYSRTGSSSSGRFEDGTLALWLEESLRVRSSADERPLVLAGSSMGGWIACSRPLRPERASRWLGIASAPDFTDWGFSPDAEGRAPARARTSRRAESVRDRSLTLHFTVLASRARTCACSTGRNPGRLPRPLTHGDHDEEVPSTSPSGPCAHSVQAMSS